MASLDTNSLGAAGHEVQQGDAISNPTEAGLAGQVVDATVAAGSQQQISILSPHRAQVMCLNEGTAGRASGGPMIAAGLSQPALPQLSLAFD